MKPLNKFGSLLGMAAVLALGACADMNMPGSTSSSGTTYPQSGAYAGYGIVQSIELVKQASTGIGGTGIGAGTIAGAVVGGIVGSQVGQGQGKTAATVIGAAGGAYAGHELEKRSQQQTDAYKLTIRMNDGSYQTLTQSTSGDIRVGDRVKVENGVAQRY
ncbi:glycine zipper 2TM domain-containing protein [Rhodoferax sp.]|uniref:glycine zipper 2TM domain-containing protein n=1 Tax=Rhodoferax sp. TaxID=50421 RepID=UPI00271CD4A2|nr:glycine zipper 2TM domain-containing protein [Rhodoferax sp.]MDO9197390.1 glycine zipper 2TM domain-containing protein [Rhodoferax sp.]